MTGATLFTGIMTVELAAPWIDWRWCAEIDPDASAVRELTRTAYAKWVPVIGREPKPMGADYDRAVRDHIVDLLIR